jgi:hypothetical protein
LDSDILDIEENYNNSDGGCFWIAESIDNNNRQQKNSQYNCSKKFETV